MQFKLVFPKMHFNCKKKCNILVIKLKPTMYTEGVTTQLSSIQFHPHGPLQSISIQNNKWEHQRFMYNYKKMVYTLT